MCDFGITAIIGSAVSIAMTAASTALGVISAQNQAKTQAAQAEYQAQVQERNSKIAQNNAAIERQTGLEEARRQRMKTLQAIGSQQTALAANGIDISSGTSLDIIEDTAMLGELDALTIQYNAEKNARNYDTQAQNFASDALMQRYAAKNAKSAGNLNALSAGIQGAGKTLSTAAEAFLKLKSEPSAKTIAKTSGGLNIDPALGGSLFA